MVKSAETVEQPSESERRVKPPGPEPVSPQPKLTPRPITEEEPSPGETQRLPVEGAFPRKYTLVLDLDETLIHYKEEDEENGRVNFRPFLDEFLSEMGAYFNLVVFTASLQDYADPILNHLDPTGTLFSKRYYRHHVSELTEGMVKDLGILGMDLSKVIIVDNTPENFCQHKDNGIFIKPWYDDESDCALKELGNFLRRMVGENVDDVRVFLGGFRSEMIRNIQRGSVMPLG